MINIYGQHFRGLSTDIKPESVDNILFIEEDTGDIFIRTLGSWVLYNTQFLPTSGGAGPVSWGDITGTLVSQTDLNAALTGKAPVTHAHAAADVTGTAVLNNDARLTDARTPLSHTHTGVYEPANANIQSHVVSVHAPSNAQKNSDILQSEIEAKLTGVISTHSHAGGGSDPWTIVKLASDFPTSSATAVNVTGLAFTPAANTVYEITGLFLLRTATATVGPRPGIAWPTGMTDGTARLKTPLSATAFSTIHGNISAALLAAVGGLPTTTGSWPGSLEALLVSGAAPSGTFRIQLASETAGTNVTMKAGSYIKYRII